MARDSGIHRTPGSRRGGGGWFVVDSVAAKVCPLTAAGKVLSRVLEVPVSTPPGAMSLASSKIHGTVALQLAAAMGLDPEGHSSWSSGTWRASVLKATPSHLVLTVQFSQESLRC